MSRATRLNGDKDLLAALGVSFANYRAPTANDTLALDDAGGLVSLVKGTAGTVTIPPASDVDFAIGNRIAIMQGGAGAVTVTAGNGVTLRVDATFTAVTAGTYSMCFITKIAANEWVLNGELVAA